jgi:hypothetical protein
MLPLEIFVFMAPRPACERYHPGGYGKCGTRRNEVEHERLGPQRAERSHALKIAPQFRARRNLRWKKQQEDRDELERSDARDHNQL